MDLLDRYLQAIRWWLPRGADRDLVTELADDLRSQIEEKETELGRKLTETELVDILRRCGHPMTVAGKLLPGRSFLSPAMSVVYGFVLRVVLLGVLPVALVLLAVPALVATRDPVGVLFDRLGGIAQAALTAFVLITAIFFFVDRHQTRLGLTREWDPRRLPKLRDSRRIPRADSAAAIVVGLLFLAWWTGVASGSLQLGRLGERGEWTAAWQGFRELLYWPVLLLSTAGLALSVVALFRPYWTRTRLLARVAVDGALAVTLGLVLWPHRGDLVTLVDYLRAGKHALTGGEAASVVARLGILWAIAWVAIAVSIATVVGMARLLTWREDGGGEAPRRGS